MILGNYKITSDRYNWILQEKRISDPKHHKTTEAKVRFVDVGYFGKIEHLISAILNNEMKHLMESDTNTLQDILKSLKQIENELKNDIEKVVVKNES